MAVIYKNDIAKLKEIFFSSSDIVFLEFKALGHNACIMFLDGFVDKKILEEFILYPLKNSEQVSSPYFETLNQITCMSVPIESLNTLDEVIQNVTHGEIILLIDEAENYFKYSEKAFPIRAVAEPPVNSVLRGPREGFTEDIKTNLSLIRKRLYTKDLKTIMLNVGKYTSTSIAISYLDGVADANIVEKIKQKIERIKIDGIIDSAYVSRYLEDNKNSLFTQVGVSEKPDAVVGKMLEGRVAIIVDGSPNVLTLPFILIEHFQTAEDYYLKSYRASLLRCIRIIAAFLAIALPGIYVAFLEFQYQMLPINFIKAILKSTTEIPLTPTIEMIIVLLLFEMLAEAALRMPRYVGTALSVVGAIVIGDTAVSAGLLSSPTILVIAISTIGLYCVPEETGVISVLRVIFVVAGGILGTYGIVLLSICLISYLVSLKNYGCAYLTPYSPIILHDWQDGIIKEELTSMVDRPYSIPTKNRRRQSNGE